MILNVPSIVTIPVATVVVGVVDGGVVMTTVDADVDTGSEVVVTFVAPASVVVATEVGACVVG